MFLWKSRSCRKRRASKMVALGILSAILFVGDGLELYAQRASRLAVIRTAPDFALITHDGQTLRSADLKGRVLLVSFIFTTCNGTCPPTTHRMSQVQQELKTRGLCKDDQVRLLSITLDPVRDTLEVLNRYMQLYSVYATSWTCLAGPAQVVTQSIKAWGMWARP